MPALRSAHEVVNAVITDWLAESDIAADSAKIMALINKLVNVVDNERENAYQRGRNSVATPAVTLSA